MANIIAQLGIRIFAEDEATPKLDKVEKQAKKSSRGILSMIPGLGMFASISGIATAIAQKGFWAYAKSVLVATLATIKLGIATAVALWPIIVIIAAIAAAILIIIIIWQNWGAISEWLQKVWQKFIDWITTAWTNFVEFGKKVFTIFKNFFTGIWKGIVKFATGIWTFLKNNWKTILDVMFIIATGGLGLIFLAWKKNLFGIQDFTKGLFDWIIKLWDALLAATRGDWSQLGKVITGIVKYIVSYVMSLFKRMYDFIKKIPIIGKLAETSVKGGKGALSALGISIPFMQMGAGYVARTGLAVVHKGEKWTPSHAAPYATGGGPSVTVNVGDIVINTGPITSDHDIDSLVRQIRERLTDEISRYYRGA